MQWLGSPKYLILSSVEASRILQVRFPFAQALFFILLSLNLDIIDHFII